LVIPTPVDPPIGLVFKPTIAMAALDVVQGAAAMSPKLDRAVAKAVATPRSAFVMPGVDARTIGTWDRRSFATRVLVPIDVQALYVPADRPNRWCGFRHSRRRTASRRRRNLHRSRLGRRVGRRAPPLGARCAAARIAR
jgi:hypothetical protein